jgi:hypothetical protein
VLSGGLLALFRLLVSNVGAQLCEIEGPDAADLECAGYLTGTGHALDVAATQAKYAFGLFDSATLGRHDEATSNPPSSRTASNASAWALQ